MFRCFLVVLSISGLNVIADHGHLRRIDFQSYEDSPTSGGCGIRSSRNILRRAYQGSYFYNIEGWPWVGSLRDHLNQHLCSAVLISQNIALTTASCFDYENDVEKGSLPVIAVFGSTDKRLIYAAYQHTSLFDLTIHPGYRMHQDFKDDIAILHLHQPVKEFTSYVKPVCVNTITNELDMYTRCTLAGWGWMEDVRMPHDLQTVDISLSHPAVCESVYGVFNNASFLCVGATTKICSNDKGSPLICQENTGRWVLVGLSSYETTDCDFRPVGYTRISTYLNFIPSNGSAMIPISLILTLMELVLMVFFVQ